ncbi:CAP domain-containing protein [Parapedobacter sp. DT-150]|uniref:CAP domain-containing protein n=1 Tax=Parapedobacter sp. DT-150 TaxID=3396162 RepID=UPI003F1C8620
MLKRVVQAIICLFVVLSSCEPRADEVLEPLMPTSPGATEQPDGYLPQDTIATDSIAVLALAEINAWRQKGCDCGDQHMPPTASKVTWNARLYDAALAHARDMQANNYFSHTSPSGENVYHRLVTAAYISDASEVLSYGENIAFGKFDLKTVIQKWLASPSHCVNIMRDSYREMAIAHEGNYWVQVFGGRR